MLPNKKNQQKTAGIDGWRCPRYIYDICIYFYIRTPTDLCVWSDPLSEQQEKGALKTSDNNSSRAGTELWTLESGIWLGDRLLGAAFYIEWADDSPLWKKIYP